MPYRPLRSLLQTKSVVASAVTLHRPKIQCSNKYFSAFNLIYTRRKMFRIKDRDLRF